MTWRGSTTADAVVLVFAKAPLPGRAKTRLAPRLGDWGAARLQARLTVQALRSARAARCGEVELHGTPRARHGFFVKLKSRSKVVLRSQKGDDLGVRMANAFARALRRHRAVLLIGTDCPALRPRDLRKAMRLLRGGHDAVLAPAEDGGYALIGLSRPRPQIFSGIEWGGPAVLSQTVLRLDSLGLRWRALRTLWDVDRPADLERIRWLRFS